MAKKAFQKIYKAGQFLGEVVAQSFGVQTMTGKYSKVGDKIKSSAKNFEKKYLPLSRHLKKK